MSSRAFNIADHMKNLQGTRTLASGAKIVGADADSIQAPGLITSAGGGDNTSLNTGLASATLASTTTFPAGVIIGVENTTTTTIVAKNNTTYETVISDSITVKANSKVLVNVSIPISANTDSTPAGGQILQTGTASATIMSATEVMDEHHASSGGFFVITIMSGVLSAGTYTFSFQGNRLSGSGTVYFVSANPGSGSASIASMTLYEIAG